MQWLDLNNEFNGTALIYIWLHRESSSEDITWSCIRDCTNKLNAFVRRCRIVERCAVSVLKWNIEEECEIRNARWVWKINTVHSINILKIQERNWSRNHNTESRCLCRVHSVHALIYCYIVCVSCLVSGGVSCWFVWWKRGNELFLKKVYLRYFLI